MISDTGGGEIIPKWRQNDNSCGIWPAPLLTVPFPSSACAKIHCPDWNLKSRSCQNSMIKQERKTLNGGHHATTLTGIQHLRHLKIRLQPNMTSENTSATKHYCIIRNEFQLGREGGGRIQFWSNAWQR